MKKKYLDLLEIDFLKLDIKDAVKELCLLIDLSYDLNEEIGLKVAISTGEKLIEKTEKNSEDYGVLCYALGNAWNNLKAQDKEASLWNNQIELENQIKYYQMASKVQLHKYMKCQIFTNLGNLMSHVGKPIKAIKYWNKVLDIDKTFPMAIGNLGIGLMHYSKILYDDGHKYVCIHEAYKNLKKVITYNPSLYFPSEAKNSFWNNLKIIEARYDNNWLNSNLPLKEYSLGNTKKEIAYRNWCISNKLFLNPLNDLYGHSSFSTDIISTPNMVASVGDGPYFQSMFNQIKQEFVSARYFYYQGISNSSTHFSDENNLLYMTLDYSCYSYNLEQVKNTYKTAYSLFDKIGYFLNIYLDLGIPLKQVTFKNVWYIKGNFKKEINPIFLENKNYVLHGLFWLSKDLYEKWNDNICLDEEFKEMSTIRNFLEHKHIRIREYNGPSHWNEPEGFSYDISRVDFENKTFKILELVREAIIYLSLAINVQEILVNKDKEYMPMSLFTYEDDLKI